MDSAMNKKQILQVAVITAVLTACLAGARAEVIGPSLKAMADDPDCDIVLCGNKSDLDNDRVVTHDEGKQLADEYGVQFFETSALTGHNVEKMFTALATTIKHKRIDEFESGSPAVAGAASTDNGSTTEGSRPVNLGAPPPNEERQGSMSNCC